MPPRRLCAIGNGEPFSPPCQLGSFPKPVSGTCFSSFCPQTCRTGIWGEVCLVPNGGWWLLPPRMQDVFLHGCQTAEPPKQTNINKHRRWGKSLRFPLTTCLMRHVGERKRRHVRSRTAAVRQQRGRGKRAGRDGVTPKSVPDRKLWP